MSGTEQDDELVLAAIADIQADTDPAKDTAKDAAGSAEPEAAPQQQEMPFALVYGQAFTKLPDD
ncbi:MAG TPA: hypothetical protein VF050_13095, partial [Moraxellaceae bacterium]